MKKYIAILSILALCACTKELNPQKDDIYDGGKTLTARIVNTKVNISDLGKFSWTEGDKIAIHRSVSGYETASLSVDGTFSVHLSDGETRDGYAIYPAVAADENASGSDNLAVVLPNAYSIPKAGMGDYTPLPMVAVNDPESEDVFFRHLGGVFRLEVANLPFETQKIAFNLGKRITGSFPVEGLDTDTPFISLPDEQGEDIVFSLKSHTTSSDAIIINIPVPTGSYNVLSYKIYDRYDNLMGGNSIDIDKTVGRADGFEWDEDIKIDLSRIPLCLRMVELGQITIKNPLRLTIEYSNDNLVWDSFDEPERIFVLRKGNCLYLRGNNGAYSDGSYYTNIVANKTCYVYGNIMSLITPDPDDFSQLKTLTESNVFYQLFHNYNSYIINHPTLDFLLPATTLSPYCYRNMFYYSAINRIALPATELAEGCYQGMFKYLQRTPEIESLPAMTLATKCYYEMFSNCSLTNPPALPATTLAQACYERMFIACKSLTSPPALNNIDLAYRCYANMFEDCISLENAPVLPATEMKENCYYGMFKGCSSIVDAPELPALILADGCYGAMFENCSSLVNAPELPVTSFNFEVNESTNSWRQCYSSMFKGCTSLVNAPELPATQISDFCYSAMFENCTSLVTAPELPATSLGWHCYQGMFRGCTSLVNAPELPATNSSYGGYQYMFEGCTSLVDAPVMAATNTDFESFKGMFLNCTSLVSAPDLPATEMSYGCYNSMFSGCTSLVDAPELPATTLTYECYVNMFSGCSSLNNVKALFTEATEYTSIPACVSGWLDGVAASGTFTGNAAATYDPTDIGLPSGWTFTTE